MLLGLANNSIEKAAVKTTSAYVSYINRQTIESGHYVKLLKERVAALPYCMYFRKNSLLANPINELLETLKAGGFIYKLNEMFASRNLLIPKFMSDVQPKALRMEEIDGTLYICGLLYLVAILVFFIELIAGRTKIGVIKNGQQKYTKK